MIIEAGSADSMKCRFALGAALFFWCVSCSAARYAVAERLHSELGEIQTVRQLDADGSTQPAPIILLDGKVIFDGGDCCEPLLRLLGIYKTKEGEALLFSSDCEGSGCRIHPLHFLLLRLDAPPKLVTDPHFTSITELEIRGKEDTGKVIVYLGYEGSARLPSSILIG